MGLYILTFISIFSFSTMLQLFGNPIYTQIGNVLFGLYVFILIVTQLTKTKNRKPLQSMSSILFIERIGYQLGAHYFKEGVPSIKKLKSKVTTGLSRFTSRASRSTSRITSRIISRLKFTFRFYQFLFKKINSLKYENALLTEKYHRLEKDFNLMAQTWTPVKPNKNAISHTNHNLDKKIRTITALDTTIKFAVDDTTQAKSEKDQSYKLPQNASL